MNSEDMKLSQWQKDKYFFVLGFICRLSKVVKFIETESKMVDTRGRQENREVLTGPVSVLQDEKDLERVSQWCE